MIHDKTEYHKILLIKEFKTQLVNFLDELIDLFPKEGDLILIRIFIKDQIPMADVLGRYQRDILPFEHKIMSRDEHFFLDHPFLYAKTPLGEEKVNHFKDLWTKGILSLEDKLTVWKWMDVFNIIAKRYITHFGYIQGWEPKSATPNETSIPNLENVTYRLNEVKSNNKEINSTTKEMVCKNGVCYLNSSS